MNDVEKAIEYVKKAKQLLKPIFDEKRQFLDNISQDANVDSFDKDCIEVTKQFLENIRYQVMCYDEISVNCQDIIATGEKTINVKGFITIIQEITSKMRDLMPENVTAESWTVEVMENLNNLNKIFVGLQLF
jgi:hypothetical protein